MSDYKVSITGKNLKIFRKSIGKNQLDFAQSIPMPQSHLSNIERGKRNITETLVQKISKRYNDLNVHWLFTNEGSMIKANAQRVSETAVSYGQRSKNLYVPFEARAGYLDTDYNQQWTPQKAERVKLPNIGIEGEARTFEVRGDSMFPYIEDNDLVVCTPVKNPHEVKSGCVYVIVTHTEGLLIKFCTFLGRSIQVRSSEEKIYPHLEILLENIREIWQVKYRITPHITPVKVSYEERFKNIEEKLNVLIQNSK